MECTGCKKDKDLQFFSKCKSSKNGYQTKCKECKNAYYLAHRDERVEKCKMYYQKNSLEISKKSKEKYLTNPTKYKLINEKYINSEKGKNTIQKYNETHKVEKNKKVKINNKNRYKTDDKYKEYIKQKSKDWSKDNKERKNKRQNDRYKNDIQFKLKLNLRSRFNQSLQGNMKHSSALKLLGCSVEYLKQYLEQQFKPEMNWENHGIMWEIDHIKPCASFDLTDIKQQQECFNYINLQPLFKTTEIALGFGYINEIGNRDKSIN